MKLLPPLALCALLAFARTTFAATVVVVYPPHPSSQTTETLTYLHGELASVGLEDATIERPETGDLTAADVRPWLEQLAKERSAIAVIDILGDDKANAIDVWVRKSPGRFDVTRVAVDPSTLNPSARIAIRALEALRASLLEIDLAARYPRDERPSKPLPPLNRAPLPPELHERTSSLERLGLELGATALFSPGGVGPAVLPTLRVDWAVRPPLLLEAIVAGLGTHTTVTEAAGSSRITREYALLGASYRLVTHRPWWPFISTAVGAQHTSVVGLTGLGMHTHATNGLSFAADAGIGASMRVFKAYHLSLSGHVQLTQPYVAIHFGDQVAATTGRPNLLLSIGAGAWL